MKEQHNRLSKIAHTAKNNYWEIQLTSTTNYEFMSRPTICLPTLLATFGVVFMHPPIRAGPVPLSRSSTGPPSPVPLWFYRTTDGSPCL